LIAQCIVDWWEDENEMGKREEILEQVLYPKEEKRRANKKYSR